MHSIVADNLPLIQIVANSQPLPPGSSLPGQPDGTCSVDAAAVQADIRDVNTAAMKTGLPPSEDRVMAKTIGVVVTAWLLAPCTYRKVDKRTAVCLSRFARSMAGTPDLAGHQQMGLLYLLYAASFESLRPPFFLACGSHSR